MDLPQDLRVIHEPVRLRILGLLYRQTDLGFAALRDGLGLTAGNLGSHAGKLEEAGFVAGRDALTRGGFEKRYQITPAGLRAFERYLALLEGFLAEARRSPASADVHAPLAQDAGATAVPAAPLAKRARFGKATLAFIAVGLLFVVGEAAQIYLSDASGSNYLGVGIAGALVASLAPIERVVRRLL